MTLEKVASIMLDTCLKVQSHEKVLIIFDAEKKSIAEAVFGVAREKCHASLLEIPVGDRNGEEPSAEVASEMLDCDVLLLITSKSLSHTGARRKATEKGVRVASLPGITEDILLRCIDIDYQALKEVNHKLRNLLINSKEIHVTTEKGTDVKLSVTETHGESAGLYHLSGEWGNLPTGEVDNGVGKINGTIVIDASFAGLDRLKSPLTLEIKDGYVVSVIGEQSEEFKSILDKVGKEAYKIAEFAIGTNPNAKVTGKVLEDEKVKGTCHFAVGNDLTYGGNNDVPLHLDGVMFKPTIIIDDNKVLDEGRFIF